MKETSSQISENDIQAYVDGQLDASKQQEVSNYLADNPEEAARVESYRRQNAMLQNLYGETPKTDISAGALARRFRKRKRFTAFAVAASIAWLLLGGMLGWTLKDYTFEKTVVSNTLPQQAMVAHAVFTPEVKHPVEVGAEQEAHLVKWLSKRLGNPIQTPDLNAYGFSLVGGRLLSADSGPAAQFMYQDTQGERLTLYVLADADKDRDTAFRYFEKNNIQVFYWTDSQLGFAMAGEIGKARLLKVSNGVYQQLAYP